MDRIKKDTLFKRELSALYRRFEYLPNDCFSGTIIENWHGGEVSNVSTSNTESLFLIREAKKEK